MPAIMAFALSSISFEAPARKELSPERECLWEAINYLPTRLAQVVILRYYGENGKRWTLRRIGHRLGVSDERVRQLLKEAYSRLGRIYNDLLQ